MGDLLTATRIAARLAANGLRYRCLRLTGGPGRPQAISLEVTHRCVCRCVMCNIWRIPESVPDLTLEDWVALLSDGVLGDLRELDITGGEPYLRDDLVSLVDTVAELKRSRLKELRSVAITTNGLLTERVVDMTGQMLEPLREAGIDLVIVCALDAADDSHDRIRRHKGAWPMVDDTIAQLIQLRGLNPNLIVGIKTTVLPQNVSRLDAVAEYARERGLFTIISPAIVTGGRYLNADRSEKVTLDAYDRATLAAFYESGDFRWSYHGKMLARYLRSGHVEKPCSCGLNYLFVRSTGEVHLCPLLALSAGNVRNAPLGVLFRSTAAREIRRHIGNTPECGLCTEPGLERYALPYEGFHYLRALAIMGPREFLDLHSHLGLDKYL